MVETPMKTMNTKVDRITQDKPGELEFLFFVLARVYRLNKINVKFFISMQNVHAQLVVHAHVDIHVMLMFCLFVTIMAVIMSFMNFHKKNQPVI